MGIALNLPQPPPDERDCGECGRLCTHENDATLYHCGGDGSPLFEGVVPEAFSLWLYRCKRCRTQDTKRSPDLKLTEEEWAFINAMQDDLMPPYFKSCSPRGILEFIIGRRLVAKGLARWVSQWPLETEALYLTPKGYEQMGWDVRFVVLEE